MNLVPVAITKAIGRNQLLLQKNAPQLLFGAGIVGVIGSTVLACRATLKMSEVLFEAQQNIEVAKNLDHPEYSEADRAQDIRIVRVRAAGNIIRLYGPAVIVGGISIAALTKSHHILTSRNAGLAAAYTALEKGFNEYRSRVVAKYGEEEDRNFRYGTREITGEGKKGEKVVRVGPGDPSIYARFFDPSSPSWNPEPEYNRVFLQCQQNYMNDLLQARGHVFLNEVYDALGIPRSKAGAVVGWILGGGDDHIDFGIFTDTKNTRIRDFVNGFEGSILLDFNVDGLIYDNIEFEDDGGLPWLRRK